MLMMKDSRHVLLLSALFTGSANGIPDVPLIEADLLSSHSGRDAVLNARHINHTSRNLDGSLRRPRCRGILVVVGAGRVDVDAVHVNQAGSSAAAKAMEIKLDALVDDVLVPFAVARLAAEDELDGRVEQLDGLGPLVGLLGVVLLGQLADLPRAPALVAQRPVLDLRSGG